MKKLLVVGAAVVRDGRCLVALRSRSMSLPGKWEFPGGKVAAGERKEEALRREIAEELGVDIEVGSLLGIGVAESAELAVELHVFRATLASGAPKPLEHSEIRWIGRSEVRSLDWAEADVPVLPALEELLCEEP